MRTQRRKRGITVIELLLTAAIMLLVAGTLAGLSRLTNVIWFASFGRYGTQNAAALAVGRMGPSVRAARSVINGSSSATRLTVRLPSYSGESLLTPLADGDVISFYLSDSTGRTDRSGRVLWRSVNGVADRPWSYAGGRPRVETVPGGLRFTYIPDASDPTGVTAEITTSASLGGQQRQFTTSESFMLHNKGL